MNTSQSSGKTARLTASWAGFGSISFLTLHLLRSSSLITSGVLQAISCLLQAGAVGYYSVYLIRERPKWVKSFSRLPKGWKITLILALSLLTASHALSAQAAFYSAAEQFMTSSFPQASTAVPLIFNALRAIFLIYVAISLISVLNAARQGDDLLTIARSPAVVVAVVGIGDVLTTIIVS